MKCPRCGGKMKTTGTVDETWRFYECKCGYTSARHIHRCKDEYASLDDGDYGKGYEEEVRL